MKQAEKGEAGTDRAYEVVTTRGRNGHEVKILWEGTRLVIAPKASHNLFFDHWVNIRGRNGAVAPEMESHMLRMTGQSMNHESMGDSDIGAENFSYNQFAVVGKRKTKVESTVGEAGMSGVSGAYQSFVRPHIVEGEAFEVLPLLGCCTRIDQETAEAMGFNDRLTKHDGELVPHPDGTAFEQMQKALVKFNLYSTSNGGFVFGDDDAGVEKMMPRFRSIIRQLKQDGDAQQEFTVLKAQEEDDEYQVEVDEALAD